MHRAHQDSYLDLEASLLLCVSQVVPHGDCRNSLGRNSHADKKAWWREQARADLAVRGNQPCFRRHTGARFVGCLWRKRQCGWNCLTMCDRSVDGRVLRWVLRCCRFVVCGLRTRKGWKGRGKKATSARQQVVVVVHVQRGRTCLCSLGRAFLTSSEQPHF